jgi:hypothetical protein
VPRLTRPYVLHAAITTLLTCGTWMLLLYVARHAYARDWAAHATETLRLMRFTALAVALASVMRRMGLRDKTPFDAPATVAFVAASVTFGATVMAVGSGLRSMPLLIAGFLAANGVMAFAFQKRVHKSVPPLLLIGVAYVQVALAIRVMG